MGSTNFHHENDIPDFLLIIYHDLGEYVACPRQTDTYGEQEQKRAARPLINHVGKHDKNKHFLVVSAAPPTGLLDSLSYNVHAEYFTSL